MEAYTVFTLQPASPPADLPADQRQKTERSKDLHRRIVRGQNHRQGEQGSAAQQWHAEPPGVETSVRNRTEPNPTEQPRVPCDVAAPCSPSTRLMETGCQSDRQVRTGNPRQVVLWVPRHSMGLPYMPTLTPKTTPTDRHI